MKYLLPVLLLTSQAAFSASFDCKLAGTRVEEMICDQSAISLLDEVLADEFFDAKERLKNPAKLIASQSTWLKIRNSCPSETCIFNEYKKRLPIVSNWSEDGESKLTLQACRISTNHSQAIECIKKGVYDPCSEGGSMSSGYASACAWNHLEIAEERLERLSSRIKKRLLKSSKSKSDLDSFEKSESNWIAYRNNYCEFTNAFAIQGGAEILAIAFCKRRLTEGHVKEIESVLPEVTSVVSYVLSNDDKKAL